MGFYSQDVNKAPSLRESTLRGLAKTEVLARSPLGVKAGQLITFEKCSLGTSVQTVPTTIAPKKELRGGECLVLPLLHSRDPLRAAEGLCFPQKFLFAVEWPWQKKDASVSLHYLFYPLFCLGDLRFSLIEPIWSDL